MERMRISSLTIILYGILSLLITACGAPQSAQQAATTSVPTTAPTSAPTASPIRLTPTPFPTPTDIPTDKINLQSLAVASGELPDYIVVSAPIITVTVPAGVPKPQAAFRQDFDGHGRHLGSMTLLLYASQSKVEEAFAAFSKALPAPSEPVIDLGHRAELGEGGILSRPNPLSRSAYLVFYRCHAVAMITLASEAANAPVASDDAVAVDIVRGYAKQLDVRLRPVVCL